MVKLTAGPTNTGTVDGSGALREVNDDRAMPPPRRMLHHAEAEEDPEVSSGSAGRTGRYVQLASRPLLAFGPELPGGELTAVPVPGSQFGRQDDCPGWTLRRLRLRSLDPGLIGGARGPS